MNKTTIFIMLAILVSAMTLLYADQKQNSALITLASCKLSKSGNKVSVLEAGNSLGVFISTSENLTIKQNNSFVERRDAQSRICFSEGFEQLSCSPFSFTIQQQVCTRQSIIHESFTFFERKGLNDFYLTHYRREEISKSGHSKQPQVKIYTIREMGSIEFQDVTRDYLIRLVNQWR